MSRHIGIAIPAQDYIDAWFAHDLAREMAHHAGTYPDDVMSLSISQGALIHKTRCALAKELVEKDTDYIIFIDTDMRFPQGTFDRLTSHDVPVVAANCAKRRRPITPTAYHTDRKPVWPDREKTGLERVELAGTGVMCIRTDTLYKLPYPWFHTPFLDEEQRHGGEDNYFCALLKRHEIPLYIDHDISWAIGHIGTYTFGMKDVLGERELARQGHWNVEDTEQTEKRLKMVK